MLFFVQSAGLAIFGGTVTLNSCNVTRGMRMLVGGFGVVLFFVGEIAMSTIMKPLV